MIDVYVFGKKKKKYFVIIYVYFYYSLFQSFLFLTFLIY